MVAFLSIGSPAIAQGSWPEQRHLDISEWHQCVPPTIPNCLAEGFGDLSDAQIDRCVIVVQEVRWEIDHPFRECLSEWHSTVEASAGLLTGWKVFEVEYRADEEMFDQKQSFDDAVFNWNCWARQHGKPEFELFSSLSPGLDCD